MRNNHMNAKEFVVGAAVGSLLGSVGALLMAPKSGQKLRQNICDAYCNLADSTQDLANRGKSLAKDVGCQTCDWASKAKSVVKGKGWTAEEEEETTRDLLIGGLVGGVLGAVVGLLMAPKAGEDLRQDLVDTYEDVSDNAHDFAENVTKRSKAFAKKANSKANKWLHLAQQLVEDLTDNAQDTTEDLFDKAKGLIQNNRVHDVMDWASLGYRFWKGIKTKH